jgi:4-hydroxy-4-methyl-2-oxoglutarate aldolase
MISSCGQGWLSLIGGNDLADFEFGAMPPQVSADMLDKLVHAEVATIGHWRLWGFCDTGLSRIDPGKTIVGTAITVSCPLTDNSALHYAIGLVRPGDILVVERMGDRNIACFGDTVARAAQKAGARALILDGPCTDVQGIRAIGFPVWCRGVSGRTTTLEGRGGRVNLPVSVGGVAVMPGDALLCDDNGVLVLNPAEVLAEASKAIEKQVRGKAVLQKIEEGLSLPELSGAKAMIERAKGQS